MKTRIISGAVGIAILAVLLWLHSTIVFNIALALVSALMFYELARAEKLEKEYALLISGAVFTASCPVLARFFEDRDLSGLYIVIAFAYIVICQTVLLVRHRHIEFGRFFITEAYSLLIALSMTSLALLAKPDGTVGLLRPIYACMGAWVADSGAYFAGTFFGKHKLCPEISPKKTVEGLAGGMLANAVVFALIPVVLSDRDMPLYVGCIVFAAIGVICCLLGLLGDLTASLIKRDAGIKDYGNIMPGHGGAMDRFDSLIFIAPFLLFVVGGV